MNSRGTYLAGYDPRGNPDARCLLWSTAGADTRLGAKNSALVTVNQSFGDPKLYYYDMQEPASLILDLPDAGC